MKKHIYFLILLLFAFTSCEQEEMIDSTINQDDKLVGVDLFSAMNPLMPTGDSTQDTENLQAALHHSNLDAGGTLHLGPGTFLVHSSLARQADYPQDFGYNPIPFNGTIQGSGKGVTIIKSVRGPGGAPFTPFYDRTLDNIYPTTIWIASEDYLGVRDMTFEADSEIAEAYVITNGLFSYVATGSGFSGVGNQQGIDCIDVHFKGSLDSNGFPEMIHLFSLWGGNGGIYNVKSSEFENGIFAMLPLWGLANATINIGGSPREKVTFSNAGWRTLTFFNGEGGSANVRICVDCSVNVSYIETFNAPGVAFNLGQGNTNSNLNVTHCNIKTRPGSEWAGVELWGGSGDMSVVITNNKIHSEDSMWWGAIFSEEGAMQNGLIANNKITGRGPAAMYLEVGYWFPGQAKLVGNNLDGWDTNPNPWGFGAPIWLGSFMVNSVVIGGDNSVNIFDEPAYDTNWNPLYDTNGNPLTIPGYGNLIPPGELINLVPKNNVFTGVNNNGVIIGQDVRAAIKQKISAKKAMMNHAIRQ